MNAILNTLEITDKPERIWVTSGSTQQITEVSMRTNIKSFSDTRAREILEVLRVVGQSLLREVKEFWTTRQKGTRLQPTSLWRKN